MERKKIAERRSQSANNGFRHNMSMGNKAEDWNCNATSQDCNATSQDCNATSGFHIDLSGFHKVMSCHQIL